MSEHTNYKMTITEEAREVLDSVAEKISESPAIILNDGAVRGWDRW